MNWTELLTSRVDETFHATDGLMAMCDDGALGWKPATGSNWMTTGQLLAHLPTACGACMAGFVTGTWPEQEGAAEGDMMPTAERMPAVRSVAEARSKLAEDRRLAHAMIAEAGEAALAGKMVTAPWDPRPQPLGLQLLAMVSHLASHKSQLFYYLKLQGRPVHTGHLWGMA